MDQLVEQRGVDGSDLGLVHGPLEPEPHEIIDASLNPNTMRVQNRGLKSKPSVQLGP